MKTYNKMATVKTATGLKSKKIFQKKPNQQKQQQLNCSAYPQSTHERQPSLVTSETTCKQNNPSKVTIT